MKEQKTASVAVAASTPPRPPPIKVRVPVASTSKVYGPGLESGPQEMEGVGVFHVVLCDAGGVLVPCLASHHVKVEVEGPQGTIVPEVNTDKDGTLTVRYSRTTAGTYHIMATLGNDEPIGESPFVLEVNLVVSASFSTASGQGLEDGVFCRVPVSFSVWSRDVCNSVCSVGGAKVQVHVEPPSATGVSSPASPRAAAASPRVGADMKEPVVRDLENGSYEVQLEYQQPGVHSVSVTLGGAQVKGSPFQVKVDKAPSAGSKWQSKYEDEAAARRRQREEERIAEIAKAKENYLKHAEEAKARAAEKERRQLEEEQRQREIAEHMERMRTEEGDAVRAAVLEKVKAQGSDDIYERVDDPASPRGAGKKWAAAFNEEDQKRKEDRERQRLAEIEAAKQNYIEHSTQAVKHALTKEEKQLAEEKRLADIEEHQRQLRLANNLGGRATLEGVDVSSGSTCSSDDEGHAHPAPAPKKGPVASSAPAEKQKKPAAGKKQAVYDDNDDGSASTPSSDESENADGTPVGRKAVATTKRNDDPRDDSSELTPESEEEVPRKTKPTTTTSTNTGDKSPRSPQVGAKEKRAKRGEIPDTKGVVLTVDEARKGAAWMAGRDDIDVNHLEAYLSDKDFNTVFAMSKDKFYKLPNWRRLQLKKEKAIL